MNKNQWLWIVLGVVNIIITLSIPSTFDSGDSILHYLQAHQGLKTPHYFMNMWSKPVFMLMAFPFAVWGWIGMQIFNSLCVLGSAFAIKNIMDNYQMNGWYGVFLCYFSQSFLLVQSSGLTEPLFMLFLVWIVWSEIQDKSILAFTLLSFLPFIRSEGYIIILLFFAYSLFQKRLKYIPFIGIGTFCFGILGLFYFNDFLWMFHQNPYAGIETKYGHGSAMHYIEQLPYIIGLPIFILFVLGIFRFFNNFKSSIDLKELFLIYGVSLGYIAAHSIFWTYGLFHSFGLTRVLIVIIPFLIFIAYRGIEWICCAFHFVTQKVVLLFLGLIIFIFPFTSSPMALSWENDIQLEHKQLLMNKVNLWLMNHQLDKYPTYTNAYTLPFVSKRIIDNENEILELNQIKKNRPPKSHDLIVWDSYFAMTDAQIDQDYIEKKLNAKPLKSFMNDKKYKIVIYQIP